jgi:hypothetical protein
MIVSFAMSFIPVFSFFGGGVVRRDGRIHGICGLAGAAISFPCALFIEQNAAKL